MIELAGKRVVMTGATGFIGRNVTRRLLDAGAEVYALVRPESRQRSLLPENARLHILPGSLESIREALRAAGLLPGGPVSGVFVPAHQEADLFLHFAWGGVNREEIDSPAVQAQNVALSLECLAAARELGCHAFMDAGSRVEYGVTEDGTMEESMACRPVNEYGKAKLAFYREAARRCRAWGLTYYHLRFFSVYGAGDHPWSIISTLTRELPHGKTVSLSACRHRWNFMDIRDASRAVLELYRHSDAFAGQGRGAVHIVNVASADTRVLRDFAEEIHALAGGRGELEYGTFVQAKEGALSVCPVTKELSRLTEGTWKEEFSFREGIENILAGENPLA